MTTVAGGDRVRVLRAVGASGDTLALRRALERAVAPAALHGTEVPARAIVCVRRLRMPRAGVAAPAWRETLEARVRGLASQAVRPIAGAVPADAMAVLFRDEVELLACLARDGGRTTDAWWWRGLFGEGATPALVQRRLLAAPELVPATIALLAADRSVDVALAALPEAVCEALVQKVCATFVLPRAWAGDIPGASPSRGGGAPGVRRLGRAAGVLDRLVIEAGSTGTILALTHSRRALLAIALLVVHAPATARTVPLEPLLRRWIARRSEPRPHAPDIAHAPLTPPTAGGDALVTEARTAECDASEPAAAAEPLAPVPRPAASHDAPGAERAPRVAHECAAAPEQVRLAADDPVAIHSAAADIERAGEVPVVAPGTETVRFASAYAGVFYLVNVVLGMELYGDFTAPAHVALPMMLADLLALVAERECGPAVRDDGIWSALAALAGRDAREDPEHAAVIASRAPRAGARARRRHRRAVMTRLARTVHDMRERVSRATGDDARDSLRLLCERPGDVEIGATRVAIHFSLAEHPLAIRLAGLDRDCGWVPALGRHVEFVYA